MGSGPPALVVTSISAPNRVLRELATQSMARGLNFFLIGDLPSPPDFSLPGCRFYNLQQQEATGFELAKLLPTRHYARKNIGYLLAMRTRPAVLLETDDDNMPLPEFWAPRALSQRAPGLSGTGWSNVYRYFSEIEIWPRGLPLDAIRDPAGMPAFESLEDADVVCPIQQGLADGNPDVDAVHRLVFPYRDVTFRRDRKLALGPGTWCPFNSQNTAWFPDAFPLLYLPSNCSFRMTDIWRSFVAQRIAWENGWSVLFRGADVFQERNEHDLMRDFADEVPGYLHNRKIGDALERLNLAAGAQNIGDNLVRCYEAMIAIGVVGAGESALVQAWVKDVL